MGKFYNALHNKIILSLVLNGGNVFAYANQSSQYQKDSYQYKFQLVIWLL